MDGTNVNVGAEVEVETTGLDGANYTISTGAEATVTLEKGL